MAAEALLREIFTPERITCRLEAEDKSEVFEELVDMLVTQYDLDNREQILDAIRRREEKMSTGIKRGIAIPHAKTPFTRGVIGVLGISKSGIDYESLDGEPVHLLFLLVSSEADAATHLSVLKRIALLVEKAEFYSEMLSVRDAEHANEVIGRFEASILPHDC